MIPLPYDNPELRSLISAVHERNATPEQILRAQDLLQSSPEARQLYIEYVSLIVALQWSLRRSPTMETSGNQKEASNRSSAARTSTPVIGFLSRISSAALKPVVWSVVGVGLLFAGYFMAISWDMLRNGGKQEGLHAGGGHSNDRAVKLSTVATVTNTNGVRWSNPPRQSDPTNPTAKSPLGKAEQLSIDAGLIELELVRGASLVIEGPATWTIDDGNRVTLSRGRLVARVTPKAKGFTVVTPAARVVDLGTEFAVEVAQSGVTEVHVIQGEVDLYRTSRNASGREIPTARLRAGEAARADVSSSADIAVNYQPEKFARSVTPDRSRSKAGPTKLLDLSKSVATQSSTWSEDPGEFSASAALDGVPVSVAHTSGDAPGQWWQVDLGQTLGVVAVELTNRSIRCGWLRDIRVKILGEDGQAVLYESELLNPNNEAYGGATEFERGPAQLMLDVQRTHGKAVPGRFIRLERVACEATAELAPQDIRPEVIAAAGKAIVLSEVKVFVESD